MTNANTKNLTAIPDSKPHFEILDGLRGIAAICVVCFHFMEMAYSDYSRNFIGHGFLAVDFFFCLSGFVIGYAYDDRISKIGIAEFFKARVIRLHPLVIFGSILGLIAFLFDPFGGYPEAYSAGNIALLFLTSALLIPYPAITERSFNLFGLNAPAWSLFWEYIANIVYALFLCRLNRRWLLLITAVAAVLLCFVCYRAGNLMGGWGGPNFWDGGARVAYSFAAGLLVYRSGWVIRNRLGFIGAGIMLLAALLMPFGKWNFVTEPLVIIFYFPLIVALGAGALLSPRLKKVCNFSGRISYPLYMTHYFVIWMFSNYYNAHKPATEHLTIIIIAGIISLVGFAYLVMIFYDIPVRRYLTRLRKNSIASVKGN